MQARCAVRRGSGFDETLNACGQTVRPRYFGVAAGLVEAGTQKSTVYTFVHLLESRVAMGKKKRSFGGGFGGGGNAAGGGGGAGMGGMLAQLQKMQQDMQDAQSALENETVEVSVGGGALTIVVTGHQRIQSIKLNPAVLDTSDPEWATDLEDIIMLGVNQAIEQSQAMAAEKMENISGGLGSMPGLGGLLG